MSPKSGALALLMLAVFSGSPARATTFYMRPFPETIERTGIVVRGTAGASHTRWAHGAGQERIYTYTELELTEILKGEIGDSRNVVIRDLGGEKDGIAMEVSGTSKFRRGEDVVLMLKGPNADGSYDVLGMMMGKLSVRIDSKGDEVLSGPALGSPGVKNDHEMSQNDTGEGQNSGGRWTLSRLRELIRSQAGEPDRAQEAAPKEQIRTPAPQARKEPPAAPALQPQPFPEAREPEVHRHGTSEISASGTRLSFRIIGFGLAAVLALGAVLAFVFKDRRRR